MYGHIEDEVKLFVSVEVWILHGAKITLYRYMYTVCWHRKTCIAGGHMSLLLSPRENRFSCKKNVRNEFDIDDCSV